MFSVLQSMVARQQPVLWLEENDTGILTEKEDDSSSMSIDKRIIGEELAM